MLHNKHANAKTDEIIDFAQDLLDQARLISMRWFRHRPAVELKADASPVTVADREVEAFLRQAIQERYPDHGLLGEEYGAEMARASTVWAIDPIDGTRSFMSGHPLWGCLLAVLENGRPDFGAIDIPCTGERWVAARGRGTWLNGQRCRSRASRPVEEAILFATGPEIFHGSDQNHFEALSQAVQLRRYGSDCYAYGLLASGQIDLVAEADLKPYDYLALIPVIQEAGGLITDWQGNELSMDSDGHVLAAANATIHRQALALLQD